jgi:hypothetical protein
VFEDSPSALDNGYGGGSAQRGAAEDPGAFGERMKRLDLGVFSGKAQGLGADAKMSGGFGQIEPALDAILGSTVHRDLLMRTQWGYALARPAVAVARRQRVPVQQAGYQIIICDEDQLPDCADDVGGGAVSLASTPAG